MKFFGAGICCLLAFEMLAFGGVEQWAQAVLKVGAAVLLVIWAVRQYRIREEQLWISSELAPLGAFALVTGVHPLNPGSAPHFRSYASRQ
jgi:hypothetical protein